MSRGYVVLLVAPAVLSLMLAPTQVSAQRLGGPRHSLAGALSQPSSGSPVRGGTLIELGQGDMGSLDSVSDYVALGGVARMFTRQLFGYPDSANFADQLTVVPDVATAVPTASNGGISDRGRTYTIHIKRGVMWDTAPPRQVTSDDFVREFKMLCNPVSPTLTPGYFENTIMGMHGYCNGFANVKDTVGAIDHYEASTPLVGVSAPNSSTVVFKLMEPASDFLNILALGFCSARPIEYMKYLPNSAALKQHLVSDGPTGSRHIPRVKASPLTATLLGSSRPTLCATRISTGSLSPKGLPPRTSRNSWKPGRATSSLMWAHLFKTSPGWRGARTWL